MDISHTITIAPKDAWTWPTIVAEAVDRLSDTLDDEQKRLIRETPVDEIATLSLGLGAAIRNEFGLNDARRVADQRQHAGITNKEIAAPGSCRW